jgi:multidrug efflux pump subunit AcrB
VRLVVVVLIALATFWYSLEQAKLLRKEFVPPQDQNYIRMSVQTPPGSSLASTDRKVRELETFLLARPEVANVFSTVGGFTGVPNQATLCGSDAGGEGPAHR